MKRKERVEFVTGREGDEMPEVVVREEDSGLSSGTKTKQGGLSLSQQLGIIMESKCKRSHDRETW